MVSYNLDWFEKNERKIESKSLCRRIAFFILEIWSIHDCIQQGKELTKNYAEATNREHKNNR